MSNLQDIKLVPTDPSVGDFMYPMTIRLTDAGGDPELITDNQALEQDVLKAIFTSPQADGYGTVAHRVVGDKNLQVVRAMLTYSVISSLQVLKNIHDGLRGRFPTRFRGLRCLDQVDFMRVVDSSLVSARIQLDIRSRGMADTISVTTSIPTSKE